MNESECGIRTAGILNIPPANDSEYDTGAGLRSENTWYIMHIGNWSLGWGHAWHLRASSGWTSTWICTHSFQMYTHKFFFSPTSSHAEVYALQAVLPICDIRATWKFATE